MLPCSNNDLNYPLQTFHFRHETAHRAPTHSRQRASLASSSLTYCFDNFIPANHPGCSRIFRTRNLSHLRLGGVQILPNTYRFYLPTTFLPTASSSSSSSTKSVLSGTERTAKLVETASQRLPDTIVVVRVLWVRNSAGSSARAMLGGNGATWMLEVMMS